MRIRISPRGLVARAILEPGERPAEDEVLEALQEARVTVGLDLGAISRLALAEGGPRSVVVARGRPAARGIAQPLDCVVPIAAERPALTSAFLASGRGKRIDGLVQAGQILAWSQEPAGSQPGLTVRGTSFLRPPGTARLCRPGKDVKLTRSSRALESETSGIPFWSGGSVHIFPVLVVSHLARSIESEGHVLVIGDIEAGIHLRSGGDVLVDGSVHGGEIVAAGTVVVLGGVRHHASVRAGANLALRFGENASLQADGDVRILDHALFCEITAALELQVGGRLLGGHAIADVGIRARSIGSRSGTRTAITLDPQGRRRSEAMVAESALFQVKEDIARVRKERQQITLAEGPDAMPWLTEKLEALERHLLNDLRERLRILLLARRRASQRPVPRIQVGHAIFAGVHLDINAVGFSVARRLPPCRIEERDGNLLAMKEGWSGLLAS